MPIVVLLVGLRIIGLASYPAAMPDEGFWASGPRNWVLFGSPLQDQRLHSFLSPATFVLLSLWFSIVQPSLISARCFSVATGLLTCVLMGVLGRRHFRDRAWLLSLVYGASGLAVFIDRSILLESHQMFWLVLAAALWLDPRPARVVAAGAAFGVALLVKSNSLYLMPAFCLSLPRQADLPGGRLRALISFLSMSALVAASGYLTAWAIDPKSFITAFTNELDGVHLVTNYVLLHFGRAGLNPHLLRITAREFLFADPFVVLSGLSGMVWIFSRWSTTQPADRLFASWAALGLLSNLIQIYPQYRYVTTTAPALAYLGVRLVDSYVSGRDADVARRPNRIVSGVAVVIACTFVGYQVIQFGRGVHGQPNHSYWRLVEWITKGVPREANVLAAPYIGISLPNRSYDFFPLIYGYDGVQRPLERVVADHGISRIIADYGQWHQYQNADMKAFLLKRCVVEATVDSSRVFVCAAPVASPEVSAGHSDRNVNP
jgi:hypothetical protein